MLRQRSKENKVSRALPYCSMVPYGSTQICINPFAVGVCVSQLGGERAISEEPLLP